MIVQNYLLSIYHVSGPSLRTKNRAMNKTEKVPALMAFTISLVLPLPFLSCQHPLLWS